MKIAQFPFGNIVGLEKLNFILFWLLQFILHSKAVKIKMHKTTTLSFVFRVYKSWFFTVGKNVHITLFETVLREYLDLSGNNNVRW